MTRRLLARARARIDAIRGSFFFIPALAVLIAIALSQGTLLIDLSLGPTNLPTLLDATVSSARVVLSTIAGATITFAGIAFSISVLMLQLASGQFSPRVLYVLFRDRVSKRVMAIATGTFTYSLLVLRAVQAPAEETAQAVIPSISVLVALLLGVITILAIISFINHIAHSMQVGEIIRRISDDTTDRIRTICPDDAGTGQPIVTYGNPDVGAPLVVVAEEEGWIQQIDQQSLMNAAPEGATIRCDIAVGEFIMPDTVICSIWPKPDADQAAQQTERTARAAIVVGRARTMQEDISFGIRQIVDIALRALSPGVNDPTTARESIVHLGVIVRELLVRDLPSRIVQGEQGRRLFMAQQPSLADYIGLAFDEIRRIAEDTVAVTDELLAVQMALVRICERRGLTERAKLVRDHAKLVLDNLADGDLTAPDVAGSRRVALELALHGAEERLAEIK